VKERAFQARVPARHDSRGAEGAPLSRYSMPSISAPTEYRAIVQLNQSFSAAAEVAPFPIIFRMRAVRPAYQHQWHMQRC
jgi:hypothetical protein